MGFILLLNDFPKLWINLFYIWFFFCVYNCKKIYDTCLYGQNNILHILISLWLINILVNASSLCLPHHQPLKRCYYYLHFNDLTLIYKKIFFIESKQLLIWSWLKRSGPWVLVRQIWIYRFLVLCSSVHLGFINYRIRFDLVPFRIYLHRIITCV